MPTPLPVRPFQGFFAARDAAGILQHAAHAVCDADGGRRWAWEIWMSSAGCDARSFLRSEKSFDSASSAGVAYAVARKRGDLGN